MTWLKPIKQLAAFFSKGWHSVVDPINPNNEKFNVRTRFKMALLSFFVLCSVFLVAFWTAVKTTDVIRTELFLSFAEHISYVLGAVVASYVGLESIWPSQQPYWSGGGGNVVTNVFRRGQQRGQEQEVDPKKEPPVSPDHNDAQVD